MIKSFTRPTLRCAVAYLIALALIATAGINPATAQTNPAPQSLPYNQAFASLTGSTTVYPTGWQGWIIAGALATTFPTTAPSGDQALAGGTNATTTAGVYDMNGKIGIVSTGSNMRSAVLSVNTTGLTSIVVSFDAATQAQLSAGRINELGLQYRVGTTGTFTNVVGSTYQNNATSTINSGTASSNIQNISVTLPAAAENAAEVQLRWVIRD
ncbi:MAG TPA: hypothetical protein VEY71_07610, partial [Chitinophagales bacterium]|nr:hypothetical protein [Chitinophagales bacterium]